VLVNGSAAKASRENFAQWEVVLATIPSDGMITAIARDNANNTEQVPHKTTPSVK
jgi:hypothetical protein